MKVSNKKKVGYLHIEAAEYERKVDATKQAYNKALEFVLKYVVIKNEREFFDNPIQCFKQAYIDRYTNDYPPHVTFEKMLELSDINYSEFLNYVKVFADGIKLDFDTMLPINEPDFNVYVQGDEVTVYDLLSKVSDAVNELREKQGEMPIGLMVQATGGRLLYNWEQQRVEPNLSFVKGSHRGM